MVPESNRKAGPFTGTGQTQFDFDFYMLSADDVVVIVADADENETTLSKEYNAGRTRNVKDCTRYRAQARNLQRGPVYPES